MTEREVIESSKKELKLNLLGAAAGGGCVVGVGVCGGRVWRVACVGFGRISNHVKSNQPKQKLNIPYRDKPELLLQANL